ncbi:MAG: SPOR domain-containing protein [Fidelibacterota bacterium]
MKSLVLSCLLAQFLLAQGDTTEVDESFDPNTLNEPPLEWPTILHPGEKLPGQGSETETDTAMDGYRVQVLSTADYQTADSLMKEVSPLFGGEVYLTFDPPNYKVRVGNFRSRSPAEKAQAQLAKMGFNTAWIIRTSIETRRGTGSSHLPR